MSISATRCSCQGECICHRGEINVLCTCEMPEDVNRETITEHPFTRLQVYDRLRDMHKILRTVYDSLATEWESETDENAIDAVNSVLYLAEGVFAKGEEF